MNLKKISALSAGNPDYVAFANSIAQIIKKHRSKVRGWSKNILKQKLANRLLLKIVSHYISE